MILGNFLLARDSLSISRRKVVSHEVVVKATTRGRGKATTRDCAFGVALARVCSRRAVPTKDRGSETSLEP